MTTPSQRRVTWAEVAEWLPDGEAEVAFDRDVGQSGMEATLYLLAIPSALTSSCPGLVGIWVGGILSFAFELWAIDEEAALAEHQHDVRAHGLSFPERVPMEPCRCRVWRGPERGWERPGNAEREQRAKRGSGLYMTVGGRAEYVGRR